MAEKKGHRTSATSSSGKASSKSSSSSSATRSKASSNSRKRSTRIRESEPAATATSPGSSTPNFSAQKLAEWTGTLLRSSTPGQASNVSPAYLIASLPKAQREAILSQLTEAELEDLLYDWRFHARPNQLPPPGKWVNWLLLAGRGFGKTRTGGETVRAWAESGRYRRIAMVAPTAKDVRDVMVEGESGLLAICPPWNRPRWEPAKGHITWPSGVQAFTYSADQPDRLRGPQHDAAWCDELAAWRRPEAWDMLMFGLRLGNDPRVVITTTPKPVKLVRELLASPNTATTRGSTYDNRQNLAATFFASIIKKYEGTRLGRQELLAEVLDDTPGALWTRSRIDANRRKESPDLVRIVIGVDPAVSATEESDETGIVVAGKGVDGHGYTLADLSGRLSPDGWAKRVVNAFWHFGADRVIAEGNNGGDMVASTIRTVDPRVPVHLVHASRGKVVRAEPVAAMDEQGRDHHVGAFPELEDQMCTFVPGLFDGSPDRMDAKVWAYHELFLQDETELVTHEEIELISPF